MKSLFSLILISAVSTAFPHGCCKHDNQSLSLSSGENACVCPTEALDAIHELHRQLDDDENGNVDLFESDEFLREELDYQQDYQNRQENFHKNNDDQVSAPELWTMWVNSPVYNWTIDQTAEWVAEIVELPQYSEKFRRLKINGTDLPRLAVNHNNFLTVRLGIKDFIVRQKLSLKAQDAVLFGPPKDTGSHTKDIIFVVLLLAASSISYLVYCRNVKMSKAMMQALKISEASLKDLQNQLEQTKRDDELKEKKDGFLNTITLPKDIDEITKLQDEIKLLRGKLHLAEIELQLKRWIPPQELVCLLQATYDQEIREHKRKQQVAEKLLKKAEKTCDKLRKRRSSFLYAFIPIHSRIVDDVDSAVLNAKTVLTEVTDEREERMHRWNEIEELLNPDIELQADSRSISIHTTESWSHSKTFIEAAQDCQIE